MGILTHLIDELTPGERQVQRRKALVLFNVKAGGVAEADRDRLKELVADAFQTMEFVGIDRVSKEIFRRDADVIIVLGGDGTARAVAEAAPMLAPPLILLPGGTLNILPKALYGDLAWPEALQAALERGSVRRLAYGRANGERFFVAAMFGAPTLLARAREAVREWKFMRAARRFRHFTKRAMAHKLLARPEGARMARAEAVGVLCPSFSGAVEGDALEWARLDAGGVMDLFRLGMRGALGPGWREDPAVDLRRCKAGDIVSLGVIPATLDGEPHTFYSRVRITFDKRGPRVVCLDPDG
ncbi:MAG: NAD(+)/NADH kinase [Hyphomonadaceae bacterium]|nr:NAD(+)/NADH kinase [Hyphomonadaceae bacterium]